MRRVLKYLLMLLIVAAMPLRGYATVAAGMCDAHHGGTVTLHAAVHEYAGGHSHEPDTGNQSEASNFASVCSLCASCCGGATLALDSLPAVTTSPYSAGPIPFDSRAAPGHVPETLVRPPLAL